ncbi:MAG: sugar ABC transporter permease [Pyrinomonadaceae bacterium]
MSQVPNEPAADRPPVTADVTPLTHTERIKALAGEWRAYTMLFALAAIWLFFHYLTGGVFLSARNFSNLMLQTSVTGVLAVGMLMVIVTGQIDLSVGSLVGLTGGISAVVLTWLGWGLVPSLLAAIIVGLLIASFQGFLVAYVNIPAFIVTLGGLLAWRGAILGISKGKTIPISSQLYRSIGQCFVARYAGWALAVGAVTAVAWFVIRRSRARVRHGLEALSWVGIAWQVAAPAVAILIFVYALNSYAGIPIPVMILLVVALAGVIITQNTTFGRYLYAIGGNPEAARLSGISLRKHILVVFGLMGTLAGVSSVIYTARVASASPDAGTLLELDAIAACVIGGTSLMGGRGTVFGAIVGALIMASLDNGMSLKSVEPYVQYLVKGAVLVTAVGFDMISQRRR